MTPGKYIRSDRRGLEPAYGLSDGTSNWGSSSSSPNATTVKAVPVLLPSTCMSPIIATGTGSDEPHAPGWNPQMIAMAMKGHLVVASGQICVMVAHNEVKGIVTVSGPSLSSRNPDGAHPKPDRRSRWGVDRKLPQPPGRCAGGRVDPGIEGP